MFKYAKPEKFLLKNHPNFNEKWVQERIAEDPSLLGVGDVVVKDKERTQPRAGRLDLLLQETDSTRRYEVEIQLGRTDEAHIIRTIEYWDIERKRYPQYDHVAIIIAENITSRFLNVINLFNGIIPLIAIQMQAIKFGDQVSLLFTTVLDQVQLGLVDEDEEVAETTDRSYWEQHGSKATLLMTDELLEVVKSLDSSLNLKYNKFYIGLSRNGQPSNFVIFRPKKDWLRFEMRLERSDEIQTRLEEAGIDVMDYDRKWSLYRIRLSKGDIKRHEPLLRELISLAFNSQK